MEILAKLQSHCRPLAILVGVALAGFTVAAEPIQDITPNEVEVAFIYNFAKFVEWPPKTFAGASSPITICTVGSDAVVAGLLTLSGKLAQERSVRIQTILHPEDAQSCQILFLSETAESHFTEYFNAIRGRGVLTVGNTDGFAERGGMIGFFIESRKVRFAINAEAARRSGLVLSSKLLAVARVVQVP